VWSDKGPTLKGIRYCNHPDTELCFPGPRSDLDRPHMIHFNVILPSTMLTTFRISTSPTYIGKHLKIKQLQLQDVLENSSQTNYVHWKFMRLFLNVTCTVSVIIWNLEIDMPKPYHTVTY
jgi:hypothetical protein